MPVLDTVTSRVLVCPTVTLPKAREVGDTEMFGVATAGSSGPVTLVGGVAVVVVMVLVPVCHRVFVAPGFHPGCAFALISCRLVYPPASASEFCPSMERYVVAEGVAPAAWTWMAWP